MKHAHAPDRTSRTSRADLSRRIGTGPDCSATYYVPALTLTGTAAPSWASFTRASNSCASAPVIALGNRLAPVLAHGLTISVGEEIHDLIGQIANVAATKHFPAVRFADDAPQRCAIRYDDRLGEGHIIENLVGDGCFRVLASGVRDQANRAARDQARNFIDRHPADERHPIHDAQLSRKSFEAPLFRPVADQDKLGVRASGDYRRHRAYRHLDASMRVDLADIKQNRLSGIGRLSGFTRAVEVILHIRRIHYHGHPVAIDAHPHESLDLFFGDHEDVLHITQRPFFVLLGKPAIPEKKRLVDVLVVSNQGGRIVLRHIEKDRYAEPLAEHTRQQGDGQVAHDQALDPGVSERASRLDIPIGIDGNGKADQPTERARSENGTTADAINFQRSAILELGQFFLALADEMHLVPVVGEHLDDLLHAYIPRIYHMPQDSDSHARLCDAVSTATVCSALFCNISASAKNFAAQLGKANL